jgi:hypothetical protein
MVTRLYSNIVGHVEQVLIAIFNNILPESYSGRKLLLALQWMSYRLKKDRPPLNLAPF